MSASTPPDSRPHSDSDPSSPVQGPRRSDNSNKPRMLRRSSSLIHESFRLEGLSTPTLEPTPMPQSAREHSTPSLRSKTSPDSTSDRPFFRRLPFTSKKKPSPLPATTPSPVAPSPTGEKRKKSKAGAMYQSLASLSITGREVKRSVPSDLPPYVSPRGHEDTLATLRSRGKNPSSEWLSPRASHAKEEDKAADKSKAKSKSKRAMHRKTLSEGTTLAEKLLSPRSNSSSKPEGEGGDKSPGETADRPRGTPKLFSAASWTSRAHPEEEWDAWEGGEEAAVHRPLIDRTCLLMGFHIEKPVEEAAGTEDRQLYCEDRDVPFFEWLVGTSALQHYVGRNGEGQPVIVSMEDVKAKKFQRTIIRTPVSDERLIVPTSGVLHRLRALLFERPSLCDSNLVKVRREDRHACTDKLLQIESDLVEWKYKFGVLYAKPDQTTEEEFFGNEHGSPLLDEFLSCLGDKIELWQWPHFRGGLDVQHQTTGTHSYYTRHHEREIMFHVSTLIPYKPRDDQQLDRKRHLGNDVVLIVFKEGDRPFNPLSIRSHFNHVFVVVSPLRIGQRTHYRVEWCAKPGVPPFKPFSASPALYPCNEDFRDYFLLKLLNAQRAAMSAQEFRHKMERTRAMLFEEVVQTFQPNALARKEGRGVVQQLKNLSEGSRGSLMNKGLLS